MILFCSDLDNTLIYSYRKDIGMNKSPVESYQNREISFMTETSLQMLSQISEKFIFVPCTTRSMEQYERIHLNVGIPSYALVCNGGVLLVDGQRDLQWYEESLKQAAYAREDLELAMKLLEKDVYRSMEIRFIENLMLFTKSDRPETTMGMLKEGLQSERVDILNVGNKVYVVPKTLNKGIGVKRLKERLGAEVLLSAGDSLFDVPMLMASDFAFAPEELAEHVEGKPHIKVFSGKQIFSDALLQWLSQNQTF